MTAATIFAASATPRQIASRRAIAIWLFAVAALIVAMVVLGGLTRLTGSGLSITEWKPIHGALPPLSAVEWQQEFDAYKAIPQYQQLNKGMTLEEFKGIFWWEWAHRNLGRFIGFAFLIPFLAFAFQRRIEPSVYPRLIGLFVLGGLQGALGWFMVMSGLQDRVEVSQYRLVAHLGLAVAIYAAMLWTALPLWRGEWPAKSASHPLLGWAIALTALVYFQMLLGGFVAGLHAGLVYNTWPLMDGHLIPNGLYPSLIAPFEDVTTAQFDHRMIAYLVAAGVVALWLTERRRPQTQEAAFTAHLLLTAVGFQIALGIWTLLEAAPVWLSAVHQLGAVALFTAALLHVFALRQARA
ncbi:MAG: heme A synthase [Alphaproteobacteria bacterium]|nr:heme A synthase [Alphaproteobacteria bacterium]